MPGVVAIDGRSPEKIAAGRSQLAATEGLVTDDDVQMVLKAWSEGIRDKAAAEDLGFNTKCHDAALRAEVHIAGPSITEPRDLDIDLIAMNAEMEVGYESLRGAKPP
ncbi:hypothetical protein CY658_00815 [Variovorax sp. RO1]|uniref:hypothetical protein n=1 Tax=Variovorax sp. RO1 TaxID=2066034 RepID=UPI000C717BE9|nr:hypothetical protein [Variovorax sp. RO1]PLC05656.1 hypothetical protein CY658_00815 [Variovorax sp. RO1]